MNVLSLGLDGQLLALNLLSNLGDRAVVAGARMSSRRDCKQKI